MSGIFPEHWDIVGTGGPLRDIYGIRHLSGHTRIKPTSRGIRKKDGINAVGMSIVRASQSGT